MSNPEQGLSGRTWVILSIPYLLNEADAIFDDPLIVSILHISSFAGLLLLLFSIWRDFSENRLGSLFGLQPKAARMPPPEGPNAVSTSI